jgi:hypothetical protein
MPLLSVVKLRREPSHFRRLPPHRRLFMKTTERLWRFLPNCTSLRLGLFIFLIAFLVRVAFIVLFHPYRDLARYELERTAISLATTGVYGNPYAIPTGPTAHVSPGYTVLLAGLFRVFGTGISAQIIKELLASSLSSLACAVLPAVARVFRIDVRAGVLAGIVSALYPATPLVQIEGSWEAPYTALALIVLSVLTVRLWRSRDLTRGNALLHGIAWGISLLFVSALLPMFIVFVLAGTYFCRAPDARRYMSFAAVEVLVATLFLAPWAIRNQYALGSPIVTRSNFGLELRISNNDLASPDQRVNLIDGLYDKYHPLQNAAEAVKVREMGEVAYNKQAGDEAKQWIRTHPWRFLVLCLGRMRCFWLYQDPTSRMKTIFLNTTVLLGFAGLVSAFKSDAVTGIVLALVLLIYPLPSYLIHVGLRQEYPIQWLMTLLSAALIVRLIAQRT